MSSMAIAAIGIDKLFVDEKHLATAFEKEVIGEIGYDRYLALKRRALTTHVVDKLIPGFTLPDPNHERDRYTDWDMMPEAPSVFAGPNPFKDM